MVFSMTGFADRTIEISINSNIAHLHCMIKSLNSRFFEATCKLPPLLQPLEIECIKMLKDSLHRGKVTLNILMSNPLALQGKLEPSFYMVQNYLDALEKIQKKYAIPGIVSISELVALPNIFIEEEITLNETMKQLVLSTIMELIHELRKAQHCEGMTLQQDIEERINLLKTHITTVETLAITLLENNKNKIHKKLTLIEKGSADVTELATYQFYHELERMDIHEEIIRFKSHLNGLIDIITAPNIEKGRHIDFIIQELMREINTIGSKCVDTTISTLAITIKVELEKIREQAQNIV